MQNLHNSAFLPLPPHNVIRPPFSYCLAVLQSESHIVKFLPPISSEVKTPICRKFSRQRITNAIREAIQYLRKSLQQITFNAPSIMRSRTVRTDSVGPTMRSHTVAAAVVLSGSFRIIVPSGGFRPRILMHIRVHVAIIPMAPVLAHFLH
jgi:hypothetical protein